MTDAAQTFEKELEVLGAEAKAAAKFLYAHQAIHGAAARHTEVEVLLNTAPLFWETTLSALQASAFIALGRVFDESKDSHGIARLLRLAIASPEIFMRDALAARKQGNSPIKPEWLDEFIAASYEPSRSDFEFIQQKTSEIKTLYDQKYKPIRNKIYAHKDIKGNAKVHELFAQTNIDEWQTLILFPQSLYNALRQLFDNGNRPTLREHPHAIADMISKPIPPGQQVPSYEEVAHETAEFLRTVAKGKS